MTHNYPSSLYFCLHFRGSLLPISITWMFSHWLLWLSTLLPLPICPLPSRHGSKSNGSDNSWPCSSTWESALFPADRVLFPPLQSHLIIQNQSRQSALHFLTCPLEHLATFTCAVLSFPPVTQILFMCQSQVQVWLHPWCLCFKPNRPVLNFSIDKEDVSVWVTVSRKSWDKNLNAKTLFGNYGKHYKGVENSEGEEKRPIKGSLSSQLSLKTTVT